MNIVFPISPNFLQIRFSLQLTRVVLTQHISVLHLSVCAWLSSPCLPGERCRCFLGVVPTEAQGKHCAFSHGSSPLFSWIWGKDEVVGYGFPHKVNPGSICVPYNPTMCCKMVVSFSGGQETDWWSVQLPGP